MTDQTTRPVGRPDDYKPEYCDKVEKLGLEGKSVFQIAKILRTSTNSIYRWEVKYPEFRGAMTRAKDYYISYLHEKAMDNLENRGFNSRTHELMLDVALKGHKRRQLAFASELSPSGESFSEKGKWVFDSVKTGMIEEETGETLSKINLEAAKTQEVDELKREIDAIKEKLDG